MKREIDFSEHELEFFPGEIELYRFTRHHSSFDAFHIIFDKKTARILVFGDYTDAVYSFDMRSDLTFEQVAKIQDIQYFARKCIASITGHHFPKHADIFTNSEENSNYEINDYCYQHLEVIHQVYARMQQMHQLKDSSNTNKPKKESKKENK